MSEKIDEVVEHARKKAEREGVIAPGEGKKTAAAKRPAKGKPKAKAKATKKPSSAAKSKGPRLFERVAEVVRQAGKDGVTIKQISDTLKISHGSATGASINCVVKKIAKKVPAEGNEVKLVAL